MIFGKKKAKEKEQDAKEKTSQEAQEAPKPLEVPVSVFSGRIAGVFSRMYRYIFSVALTANVAQIESGDRRLGDKELPVRLYYDDLLQVISEMIMPSQRDSFLSEFSRENLLKEINKASGGMTSYYCFRIKLGPGNAGAGAPAAVQGVNGKDSVFKADTEENENSDNPDLFDGSEDRFMFLCSEIKAEAIPNPGQPTDKCIIFVRAIKELPPGKTYGTQIVNERPVSEINFDDERVEMLVGGSSPVFFEYNSEEDKLYMHLEDEQVTGLVHYVASIDSRSDWTIFHNDVKLAKKAFASAVAGHPQDLIIRYRPENARKSKFRFHKLKLKPVGTKTPATWVVGSLSDIDDEYRDSTNRNAIAEQIEKALMDSNMTIYEIDQAKDLIYKIKRDDLGYTRADEGSSFTAYIKGRLSGDRVDESSKANYEKWLRPDYLEKMTINGNYEFESMLKLPGYMEYRCYRETLSKLNGVNHYMRIRRDVNDQYNSRRKEYELEEQNRYVAYNQTMLETMASLVEFRNVEAGPHITKVRQLTEILLKDMQARSPMYDITKKDIELYEEAATMHDIGKIVIPDRILNKEGALTNEERAVMQTHTTQGAKIVEGLNLPGQEELLAVCKDVALHHHERYNGKGYPDGLTGDENKIGVQCVSFADVFDAMVSTRCYKESIPVDVVISELMANEDGQFNPRIIESFKACAKDMADLYR